MLRSSAPPIGGQSFNPGSLSPFNDFGLPYNQSAQVLGLATERKAALDIALEPLVAAKVEALSQIEEWKTKTAAAEKRLSDSLITQAGLNTRLAELNALLAHHDRLVQLWRGATLGLFALFCFSRLFAT
jgi:hypothetical protein